MKPDLKLQMDEMDKLLCRLLWCQLQSMGLFNKTEINTADLKTQTGVSDLYGRWLAESIAELTRHNYLKNNGSSYIVFDPAPVDLEAEWQEWERQISPLRENPNLKAQIDLVQATLQVLPEILTGKILATDIMFPNSSMELVEGIYKNNTVADYFNEMLANTVCAYIREWLAGDPSARISIIEIGAGTGGTSAMVFQKLKPYREYIQEYCYTDISKAFLIHAETEYGPENPYLTYRIFNVEKPIAGQEISPGGYDLAIAANVLHATKNIHQTIQNAKATLQKNGLLLLNEISQNSLFSHLTFGLLEGWWLYEDPELRIPGSPALSAKAWQTVLEQEGFRSVFFPAQTIHDLGQQIIVAESDGVITQGQLIQSQPRIPLKEKITAKTYQETSFKQKPLKTQDKGVSTELLREKSTAYVKKLIGETLKIPGHKIDSAAPLENYGMDSILVVQLTNKLSETLANINSTLFFEYQTIDALVEHFIQTQKDSLITLLGLADRELEEEAPSGAEKLALSSPRRPNLRKSGRFGLPDDLKIQTSGVQDIAIIGLSGRYPGANNVNEYWQNLAAGRNCITEIPRERWDWRKYYHKEKGKWGSVYTKWGGFIADIDKFDPLFFQISPKEAENMDPQERVFLEEAYASIEDAGYTPGNFCDSRKVGVFVGVMNAYYPTGASYWSIANRISYLMNFQGPSMAVDTACSSSLTAIHLALESLHNGTSNCAIAGGVNLIIDPKHYLKLTSMEMLSAGDQCKAFGDGADGIVDGEGVGAVVLKPLAQAEACGDHIYGIIKGSMVNAGGKTNGYTVPNPLAQRILIRAALEKSGVNARTVSYIEAHGTGTSLGDPIEIAGLTQAFLKDTEETGYCAIGSAKTNIGHLEAAAGIAGLTKVLLQMKHRKIAPSLHSEVLNPNIDFNNTPFAVQRELTEWKRPVIELNGIRQEYPRIAGISAFGAGGSNAHVVIEEYNPGNQDQPTLRVTPQNPAIIVLSAKNEERLNEQAQRLFTTIKEQQLTDTDLAVTDGYIADIAYTLQVGREAMEERLGIISGSIEELTGKLAAFLAGQDGIDGLYRGQVKRNQEALAVFTADEDLQKAVESWINKEKYGKLLDLWVKGMVFDWNRLYKENKPRRISLPTYPFAKERYWLTEFGAKERTATSTGITAYIHPLLHQNTSDLSEQRYSSSFSGEEFFLANHVINGHKILPGAVYLEMARAAADAAGNLVKDRRVIKLKNVVWARPLRVDEEPAQVHIGIYPQESAFGKGDGEITYEIYSLSETNEAEAVVYCQGSVILAEGTENPVLDLKAMQTECGQRKLSGAEVYSTYKEIGLDYGPGYQGIETIYTGRGFVLAKLSLPASLTGTEEQFILHPCIMEGALQAAIGMGAGESADIGAPKLSLPFALQELEVNNRCTGSMWAIIQYSKDNTAADKIRKLDIDICDEQGNICARLKGFSSREPEGELGIVSSAAPSGTLILEPVWKDQAVINFSEEIKVPEYLERLAILCELGEINPESIENSFARARVISLQSKQKGIDKRFQTYVIQVFEEMQKLLKNQPAGNVLVQIVVPNQGEGRLCSGLDGLLKAVRSESPKFTGQLIEVDSMENSAGIIAKLEENRRAPHDIQIRYQDGKRLVVGWSELKTATEIETIPWRDGGVYLITGGAGGLGLIFAGEIARQVKNVTLILTGRSLLSGQKLAQVKELEAKCARVVYRQVDVSDKAAVEGLVQSIKEEFGGLQGIIHSAGLIRDNYIINKTKEEIIEVLAPKVSGLINLDQSTWDLKLDFMVLFSSLSGSLGNAGQADYSAANAFMDAYAGYRNNLVASNQRQGRTLAINWPLWKEGGIRTSRETEQLMNQTLGLTAMDSPTGIRALYHGMISGKDQVMVLEGDLKKFQGLFLSKSIDSNTAKAGFASREQKWGRRPEMKGWSLEQCLEWDLKNIINKILRIPRDRIDRDKNLAEFGFNSLSLNQLAIQLIKKFGISITPALFFGYPTVKKLTGYYISEYYETIHEFYREESAELRSPSRIPVVSAVTEPKAPRKTRFITRNMAPRVPEPIAIIGMSGRFPGARDIDELWTILASGQDMVREIPPDRFDWRQYYGDPGKEPGKTNCKWCGSIPGVREFDPMFFEISPREAEIMDPRQRLLLQESWKALEDAGYGPNQIKSQKVGMFVGVEQGDYQFLTGKESSLSSNNNAILAARLAYFMNLNGPVLAVDTACSSSLVATHQAILSLWAGECSTAIAAGVYLLLTPMVFIVMSQAGMLSNDGKCFTFDKRANGMVPSEAVAAVVLKRLSQAQADGDPIYAVIKGSGINYDGKTNGITAPSGVSQTALLKSVYDQFQVNPEEIQYIVTHGTGTKLGDPIEINALYDAFKDYTGKQRYCALTSTKTNFGHAQGASGLVSLISLVLAIRNKTIPPSLNCEQENDYINWQESPFYVNKTKKSWPTENRSLTGAVSAFGMSGTNVHMVLESYHEGDNLTQKSQEPAPYYLLAFSAKTEEALEEKLGEMAEGLEKGAIGEQDLSYISYTLFEGRYHFNVRCAMVVQDREHAVHVLKQVLKKEKTPNVFHGKVPREFTGQKAFEQYGQDLLNKSMSLRENRPKYQETLFALADLYCQGYQLDWPLLFGESRPARIHLPTYPFAREEYWVSAGGGMDIWADDYSPVQAHIHPLLHQNTSVLAEQRYSSKFTGAEFFFTGHGMNGQKVLPEVAQLEMARAANEVAMENLGKDRQTVKLKNVVWGKPIRVDEQPVQVHIGLYPEDNGQIAYEVYSLPETEAAEAEIHCRGSVVPVAIEEAPALDLTVIQAGCNQKNWSGAEVYNAYKEIGLNYEPEHQGIELIYGGWRQGLAKLSLPSTVAATGEQFGLHPIIMESALQAAVMINGNGALKPFQASVLQELEIINNCRSDMWALIQSNTSRKAGEQAQKFDIDLCDENGKICVRLKGLEIVEASNLTLIEANQPDRSVTDTQEAYELMTFEEVWQAQALLETTPVNIKNIVCYLSNPENQQAFMEMLQMLNQQTRVIFISQDITFQKQTPAKYSICRTERHTYERAFQSIREDYGEIDAILYLWALEDASCIEDYSGIVYLLQAMVASKLKVKRILLGAQFENGLERCYLESWVGFERSLGPILPNTQIAAIYQEADRKLDVKEWIRKIWLELQTIKAQSVLYQEDKRQVFQIRATTISPVNSLIKPGGTYLITGGCGGLGFLFAEHLAKEQSVNLILCGRSTINKEKQQKIKALEDIGSKVRYIQADISDAQAMAEGLRQAKEQFGAINGVIHAAGLNDVKNIVEKDPQIFQKVLAPKIKGTLVLNELLKEESLDFMCYFSSTSAIIGDFGCCDYAIGNRFLMAYADYWNQERQKGRRSGKAIVINWPLWKEGGMGFNNDDDTKMYLKISGQQILEAKDGLNLFDRILAGNHIQYIVFAGWPSRIHRFLGLINAQPRTEVLDNNRSNIVDGLAGGRRSELKGLTIAQCLEWDLKECISKLLKISHDKIDKEENLANYGFDSISLAEFAKLLTNHYGIEITPALFFGYSTVEKLIEYFLKEHHEEIQEFYRKDITGSKKLENPGVLPETPMLKNKSNRQTTRSRFEIKNNNVIEPIAIIGISGRFPGARNIDELWSILSKGENAVREIPAERFDWRKYYGDPVKEPGKMNCKWCGCLQGVNEFDPLFFEISPREAETMDPRQRLLLQESWKALEDAGYGLSQIKNQKIGMFVGVEQGDYQVLTQGQGTITSNHNGILASRLAYFLNLNGPVMAIDTACSSGLVAAHQAVLSLRAGECHTAIAAGVNLFCSPTPFIGMSQAGMLSGDGKCYTFDKRANGMVPGEAVVVVILKQLSQAKADGDPIYAVITGSGINYDGKTNGITAPNGVSQAELLKTVYNQYQVNPEEIEYIVTHGTGTKLGDPVEVNALCNVFQEYTRQRNYCALTSTKTNFGHTFAASGLLNLISLVQALRHETIPASLNFEQENDFIDWINSPFYVNTVNQPWPARNGKTRIGAVSVFGMSGTNVHMVVESYNREDDPVRVGMFPETVPYYLLVFSAKNQEVLEEKIQDMLQVFKNKAFNEPELSRISYTLLEGRHHFNYRCAMVIQDREHAVYVLKQVLNKEKTPNAFQGMVPREFTGQKVIEQYMHDLLIQSRSLRENRIQYQETLLALADLYCQGYQMNWQQLFGDFKPERIHLPTYPFAKETYWISERDGVPEIDIQGRLATSTGITTYLNPLLHQNTSILSEQRYSSTFTGKEFFLADHVVNGQKVLPGVAYLEMARAAVEAAVAETLDDRIIKLKNVVWVQPIRVDEEPVQVHIGIYPGEKGEIAYEVYSLAENIESETLYSQGSAILAKNPENPVLDLKALQAECNGRKLSGTEIYNIFKTIGLDYGPGHQGIDMIYTGQGLVLAKLSLPSSVAGSEAEFVLHPSIIDSALQAAIGMGAGEPVSTVNPKLSLPFALQELEVYHQCTGIMWAILKYSKNNTATDKVRKLDVDICDEHGNVCVRLKEFSTRVLERELQTSKKIPVSLVETTPEAREGTHLLVPVWGKVSVTRVEIFPKVTEQVVMVGGTKEDQNKIRKQYPNVAILEISTADSINDISNRLAAYETIHHIFWIAPDYALSSLTDDVLIKRQKQGVFQAFRMIKALLDLGYGTRELGWSLITNRTQAIYKRDEVNPTHASLHGLAGSMAKEYPNWKLRLIDLESSKDWPISDIFSLPQDPEGNALAYRDGEWYRQQLIPVQSIPTKQTLYKTGGVYVVIGGAGGIGEAWSEYVIRTYQAQVIWIGRRTKDEKIQAKIDRLAAFGPTPQYIAADATKRKALETAYQEIKQRYSKINGVIHSAIVLLDKSLNNMTEEQFQAGLSPKVDVSVRMAQVFKEEPLDFVLFFSSMQSFSKAAGQSNYASGCIFKDAFAHQLSMEWPCTVKVMNWSYWGNVGIVASEFYRERMAQAGIGSIEPPEAMEALERLLAGQIDQIALMKITNPLTMEGKQSDQQITIYPENLPSVIGNIPNNPTISDLNTRIEINQLSVKVEKA